MDGRDVEGRRNRLLRRVDWRFLLPDPQPRRVICFATGELAEAVALIGDETVVVGAPRRDADQAGLSDASHAPADSMASADSGRAVADLAVVVDPDMRLLRRVFETLAPGGAIYVEWHSRVGTSPPAAERRLRAAGFRAIRFYTPHPSPERANPESWIPLDAPGPVRFAFRTRPPARNRARALGRVVQERTWAAGRWLRRPATLCAIALRPMERAIGCAVGAGDGSRGLTGEPGQGGTQAPAQVPGQAPMESAARSGAWSPAGATGHSVVKSRAQADAARAVSDRRSAAGGEAAVESGATADAGIWRVVTGGAKSGAVDNVVVTPLPNIAPRTGAAPEEVGRPWESHILEGWSRWGFGRRPERLHTLLLTGGRRSINKVVGLVFGDGEDAPRVAVKIPRVPEAAVTLAREVEALEYLAVRAPTLTGVPRVLFPEARGRVSFVGQSVILGSRLTRLLKEEGFSDLARQATAWQVALGESTLRQPPNDLLRRVIEPVIQDFEMNYGHVIDAGELREAAARVRGLGSLPTVVEQRDFSPWNLLRTDDGSLAVLDWESSELDGVPGADLVYLLTFLSIYHEDAHAPGRDEEACTRVGSPDTPAGAVARDCWLEYAGRLGISPDVLPGIRLFTWMLHSRSEHERLAGDAGGAPSEAALRNARFVRFWRAELRRNA